MDCKQMLAILAIVVVALPAFAQATEHIVGDYNGWTLNFNYSAWAEGKEFRVGDTLVFKYAVGKHNVFKVSGPAFQACNVPPDNEALATGNDVITLMTPGKKWYICGKAHGAHCQNGQKLVINVLRAAEEAPAPYLSSPPAWGPAKAPSYSTPPVWQAPTPAGSPYSGPTEHIVGDEKGWTLNFNYSAWAEGRQFRVGDTLVFKYASGVHNVFKVSGSAFEQCSVPPENEAMISGNDVITLATPGNKWYICGKAEGKHCWSGMKLVIDVLPTPPMEHAPTAAPSNSPTWEDPAPVAPSISPSTTPAWKAPAPPSSSHPGPTQHMVGDKKGWTLDFNYTAWAKGKEFRVGDILVFKYAVGIHNVFKVDGPSFQACSVPPEGEALTTGNDMITLATPGRKWYICGKANGKHCQMGQKLVINVLPSASPAPSSDAPSNSPAWKAPAPIASPPTSPACKTPTPSPSALPGSKQYIVGDYFGWTLNFNYTAWAEGKEFRVGDILVFKYAVGIHNVFKVDGPSFQACSVPPEGEALTTGNDMITLATPGRKWYICGKANGKHCQMGQKLVINVLPSASPAPSSDAPSNSPAWKAPAPIASPPTSPACKTPTPSPSSLPGSKQYIVGDHFGWTLNFNYTAWAEGKEFRIGDVLVFKYAVGIHNVFKVDGPSFQACSVPPEGEALTTGNDMITLATPGRKWYICGKANGKHCQMGQKLVINVLPSASPAPSSDAPSNSPAWKAPAPIASPPTSSACKTPTPSPSALPGSKQYIVGDHFGWTLNFNYTAWAEGKEFRVGDTLVFKYAVGKHNVFKVNGLSFQACDVPPEDEALTTGNDVITLATPGKKWYICGKAYGQHCQMGQKLVINVRPAAWQGPTQSPPSGNAPSPSHGYGRRLSK